MQILINYKNDEEGKSVSINSTDLRTYVSSESNPDKTKSLEDFGTELRSLIQKYFGE